MKLHFTDYDLISFTGTMWDEPLTTVAAELLQARHRIRELEEAQRWIPVSERLPEVGKPVLCGTTEFEFISTYQLHIDANGDKSWNNSRGTPYHFNSVTHWRPLPPPPKSEKEDE